LERVDECLTKPIETPNVDARRRRVCASCHGGACFARETTHGAGIGHRDAPAKKRIFWNTTVDAGKRAEPSARAFEANDGMLPAAAPSTKGTMFRTLCGRLTTTPAMRGATRAMPCVGSKPHRCLGTFAGAPRVAHREGDDARRPRRARHAEQRWPARVGVGAPHASTPFNAAGHLSTPRSFGTAPLRLGLARAPAAPSATAAAGEDEDPALAERRAKVLAKLPSVCPGGGVGLQCEDTNRPGFFVVPERMLREEEAGEEEEAEAEEDDSLDPEMRARLEEAREMEALGLEEDDEETFELEALGDGDENLDHVLSDALDTNSDSFDDDDVYVEDDAIEAFVIPGDFDDADFFDEGWLDDLDITVSEGNEYVEAGDGGGMSTTETTDVDDVIAPGSEEEYALAALDALFGDEAALALNAEEESDARRLDRAGKRRAAETVTCARCYSLRHYGVVKNEAAEILMPSFDFKRVIGARLDRLGPSGAVVLLVIDVMDFDASFPADAVDALHPYVLNETIDVLLVANKVDLLPTQCTRTRVTSFARRRAKALGLQRASGVHLVSAHTGMGTTVLAEQLEQLLDEGKEAWVVGAQNAGKSSLINRLSQKYGKHNGSNDDISDVSGGAGVGPLASHLPGTTLGVVRLENLLPFGADVYDTPGLLQPSQVSSRLSSEEARMVLPRRRLTPRTYRAEIGSTVHIGGLGRVDVLDGPQRTMYLTVWASADVPTHYALNGFAKAEGGKADTLFAKHAGTKLVPPIGPKRVSQLGEWGSRVVTVYGSSWQRSDRDVVIGGLGWVGVGVNGEATLRVWTHEGVLVETREALVPDMARDLHRPGFSDEMSVGGGAGDGGKRPSKRVKRRGGKR
jgi:ribosome biogenesis GTPase A